MGKNHQINGYTTKSLQTIREVFSKNFEDDLEIGARFSVVQDGETLADIWSGYANERTKAGWTEETIPCIFSTGKAVCASIILKLVDAGALDYEAPVSSYWPEFAQYGKEKITVAQSLSHQAGLCAFPEEFPATDWLTHSLMADRLAAHKPLWAPGTASGYHAQTFGVIANELVRRVSGDTIGAHLRSRFENDRQDDLHCGFGDDVGQRAAKMVRPPRPPDLGEANEFKAATFLKPWSNAPSSPADVWRAAEIPASNMYGTSLAVARALQPMAGSDGVKAETVEAALQPRISGQDLVLPFNVTWAAGVFANTEQAFGSDPDVWGQPGFGGSCVIVNPKKRMTAAYVMNKMTPSLVGDIRSKRLFSAIDALV
ncbi:MAG: serine hydrolase domain-containing protein [Pseudomonadota bacterium]